MTSSKIFRKICLASATSCLIFAIGCASAKKVEEPDASAATTSSGADDNTSLGDSDSNKALGLQTVHFPYDAYTLDESAKMVLKANTDILKAQPNLKIQIEGHCDQRGGIQYNVALGEKRANISKKFLQGQGISGDRISIISFGKEKLIDTGTTEEAHAKNRRDNFVITTR